MRLAEIEDTTELLEKKLVLEISKVSLEEALTLVRAFSHYLNLMGMAETRHSLVSRLWCVSVGLFWPQMGIRSCSLFALFCGLLYFVLHLLGCGLWPDLKKLVVSLFGVINGVKAYVVVLFWSALAFQISVV
ncbi:hypothetical protein Ddye_022797 [Dipteronia dyeriana]|uniref:Uncharacterized protein n=1 Tax=Dipteronia dyeriana TaxID=168575 RepID=A0AAD9TRR6_9ROSI|nr:hypothetical protein Ddye_022797 [Dipteronia dyeriana]